MSKRKTIIFLGDGMADEPLAALGGKTPLQAARTPAMDAIARDGCSGTLLTLPDAFPTSSEVANMSVLGCDLATEYTGRGPIEAAGRGIPLAADDTAFRLNITTQQDGILLDFAGGRPDAAEGAALIAALQAHFGSPQIRFHTGVSYRNLLVLSGPSYSHRVKADKPDDNHGQPLAAHMPHALDPAAEATAAFLRRLMDEAPTLLESTDVNVRRRAGNRPLCNGVWPWSGGPAGALRTLQARHGITGAVIAAVDVIVGLGVCLGMDPVVVPGATGYIDTNYEGKADAAIEALKTHDFAYVHVEGTDEVSHEQDLQKKLQAIEDLDRRLIARVMDAVGDTANVAVLPDHPVPIALGKHTRTPVPVSVRLHDRPADAVQVYDEQACLAGALGAMQRDDLMTLLFGPARDGKKSRAAARSRTGRSKILGPQ